jgi:hypothetical protein
MVDELVKYRREITEFRRVDVEGHFNVQMERCATFWLEFHARLPHLAAFARYCMQTTRMLMLFGVEISKVTFSKISPLPLRMSYD